MHQINYNRNKMYHERLRVLWECEKAEDEMNQCSVRIEVSNMTMTDETLEIKYVLDLYMCCKIDRVI
jgi:hypothetical protein